MMSSVLILGRFASKMVLTFVSCSLQKGVFVSLEEKILLPICNT